MRGDLFVQDGIKAAIEPIRSAEVSLVHTVADAKRYLAAGESSPASGTSTAMCTTCSRRSGTSATRLWMPATSS